MLKRTLALWRAMRRRLPGPVHRLPPALLAAAALASCSALPSSGPTGSQIQDSAKSAANTMGYRIIDLNPNIVRAMTTAVPVSLHRIWGDSKPESVTRIGVGDVLSITLFAVSNEGAAVGMMEQSGLPGVRSQGLPPLEVGESGRIYIPYAGSLDVVGRTPHEVEEMIDRALARTQFQPQSVVAVTRNLTNTVFVSGDVHGAGLIPLVYAGERILEVIAQAGGAGHQPQDEVVRLHRNGRTAETSLREIIDTPLDNISLKPGDHLEMVYEPRTFLSFGASGHVSQMTFDLPALTLGEAIAKVGGPLDIQADPTSIYLFRFERPEVARRLGFARAAAPVPVIYRADMMNPQNYFLLQKFPMRDKDLIYVANAQSNQFQKFLIIANSLFNSIFEPVYTIKTVVPNTP